MAIKKKTLEQLYQQSEDKKFKDITRLIDAELQHIKEQLSVASGARRSYHPGSVVSVSLQPLGIAFLSDELKERIMRDYEDWTVVFQPFGEADGWDKTYLIVGLG